MFVNSLKRFSCSTEHQKAFRKSETEAGCNQSVTSVGVFASLECGSLHHSTVYMSLWSVPQLCSFIEMHAVASCESQGETQDIK